MIHENTSTGRTGTHATLGNDLPGTVGASLSMKDATGESGATQNARSTSRMQRERSRAAGFTMWSRRVGRWVPTMLVFGALAGIGYWGHHHDWKVPKFSELIGEEVQPDIAWCAEHGVPEADCIACNAALMPKGKLYGWCKVHGVHECVLEHPDVAQLREVPTVSRADLERAARALALRPRKKNNPVCKMHLRRIQFTSAAAVDRAGIDIGLVDRGPVVERVSASGEIVYDPTAVARLAVRAGGTVWRVDKAIGDHVRRDDVLVLVDAAEVGRAKTTLLDAASQLVLRTKNYQRLVHLDAVIAGRRVVEAEAALASAEAAARKAVQTLVNLGLPISYDAAKNTPTAELSAKLHFLGLPDRIVQTLSDAQTTSNLLPVLAPRDGVVVARDVVAGEVVDTTRTLFTIADIGHMWVTLDIPLEEARYVKIGQRVVFHPDGAIHAHTGTLTWISTDVDNDTRTVKVRGTLLNADGDLRNETFGAGDVILREDPDAIIVPSSAVHWEGCCHVVFVRDKDFLKKGAYKVFHTRSVRPGARMDDTTEIIAGLMPGEVVVTKGSAVLRAELLKGNLGAG